jgi:hypothetical protein
MTHHQRDGALENIGSLTGFFRIEVDNLAIGSGFAHARHCVRKGLLAVMLVLAQPICTSAAKKMAFKSVFTVG